MCAVRGHVHLTVSYVHAPPEQRSAYMSEPPHPSKLSNAFPDSQRGAHAGTGQVINFTTPPSLTHGNSAMDGWQPYSDLSLYPLPFTLAILCASSAGPRTRSHAHVHLCICACALYQGRGQGRPLACPSLDVSCTLYPVPCTSSRRCSVLPAARDCQSCTLYPVPCNLKCSGPSAQA